MQASQKVAALHRFVKHFRMAFNAGFGGRSLHHLERCVLPPSAFCGSLSTLPQRASLAACKPPFPRTEWPGPGQLTASTFPRQSASSRDYASAAPAVAEADEDTRNFLDSGPTLEDEFEEEKGRRSLASIFESDGEEVLEVDASQQDESLQLVNCGLSNITIEALSSRGITSLFPIQKHVYEPAAAGRDLIGRARTGSGKTLAFALPVVEKLLQEDLNKTGRAARGRAPRCIVLAPTRELAKQVEREFQGCAPSLDVGCYYGGADIGQQIRHLKNGVDVAVGTPGRVIDLIERGLLRLDEIKFVILDEADMMLSVGFAEDVEHILQGVPEERQTMLFSATMPSWVKSITQRFLQNPMLVDLVGDAQSGKIAEGVSVLGLQVAAEARRGILVDVLTVHGHGGKSIVFCERKRDADEVAAGVALAMPCEALHGDMSQAGREDVLQRFRDGRINVLVATDVAARGLDIPNVDLIVHYELPKDADSFLHRSGRTGRAGRTGTAIAMFTPKEAGRFRFIVKTFKIQNLQIIGPPGPSEVMAASAKAVARRLDNIDDNVKNFFRPAAEAVLANADPHNAMAAALAALSGILEVPKERSLLTQQQGYTTVRVTSRPGRITQNAHVFVIVRNLIDAKASERVGRVRLLPIDERGEQGAAFDVPHAIADKMFEQVDELTNRGFHMDRPKSLPLEVEQERGFGGGRSRPGGYFEGRGGYNDRRGPPGGGRGGYNDRSRGYGGGGYGGGERSSYGGGGGSRQSGGFSGGRGGGGQRFAQSRNYSSAGSTDYAGYDGASQQRSQNRYPPRERYD